MDDVTRLLVRWNEGDPEALGELMPLVYTELHKLASHYLRHERTDHTLQPTALVHEAYMRLTGLREADFNNRVHFYGAAAQVMRRILVDHARRRRAAKRDGERGHVDLERVADAGIDLRHDLVALDEALERLADVAPQPARVVELRCFGGLSIDESAAFLQIAPPPSSVIGRSRAPGSTARSPTARERKVQRLQDLFEPSAFSLQPSAFSLQPSAVSLQPSAVSHQRLRRLL
jgi:RNA polymerase sigma factor (TIGR02999 family)